MGRVHLRSTYRTGKMLSKLLEVNFFLRSPLAILMGMYAKLLL